MSNRIGRTTCLVLLCVAAAIPAPAPAAETAPLRVFDAGELTLARYDVLKRLWTGSWRAAFDVPAHGDAGAAIMALTAEAASLGADGIINLHCVNDRGGWPAGYYCYGLAIKLR